MRSAKSLAIDLLLICVATILGLVIRDNLEFSWARLTVILPYLAFSLVSALVILPASGVTRTIWRFGGVADYRRLVLACGAIVLSAVAMCFAANRLDNVMRSLPIMQFILLVLLMTGMRLAERNHRFRHLRAPLPQGAVGDKPEQVLVVGLDSIAELFVQSVAEHGAGRIQIAGLIGRKERQTGQLFRTHKVLGVPEELESVLNDLEVHGVNIERIVVTVAYDQLSDAARQALHRVERGSQIRVDYFAERIGFAARPASMPIQRDVAVDWEPRMSAASEQRIHAALRRPYWRVKRIVDVTVAGLALIVLAPVMLIVGLLTALTLGLPILFWQQRPGLGGSTFRLYKFRTLLGARDERGNRIPDTDRETAFGRFMRKTRLDELPQLFQILSGQMSFVGPRPLLYVDQLDAFRHRLAVRPGLTGWAQVNGGRVVSAEDKMALDIWYIQHASFALDCRIALKTIAMIVRREEKEDQRAVLQARMELMAGN